MPATPDLPPNTTAAQRVNIGSMIIHIRAACAAALAVSIPFLSAAELPKGVKGPAGFAVTTFAAPPNVGYPTCLAAAPTGEVFVGVDENGSIDAKAQRGRVVRCIDKNGDGVADEFKIFAEMDSPRGLWFDNNTLYVMHPPLVEAFLDDDGDGVADRHEVLVRGLGFDLKFRGADHTVNGMRMGIDGFLYIAVGDYGATNAVARDGTRLQLHGGGVVRVRPDGSGLEIVSHGQRNIYDVAVSPEMDLFTRDNTNDGGGWDVRLSHVAMTANYGYPTLFRNFSNEVVQPLADYGGGSPCGSLFMDEPGFPKEIGTALYTCEWGRSKIYRHPLKPSGATFKAQAAEFMDLPRATDMDVDGSGRIYVASWANGGFTYSGPNVGYVLRLVPQGYRPTTFPNLKKASDAQLIDLLQSPSATGRLHTQREILRRANKAQAGALEKLAASHAGLPIRVAAIFTLHQLAGAGAHEALSRLARQSAVREFALRALADDKATAASISATPFVEALTDGNPRVRLQAVTALGRLQKTESAAAVLPLVADPDPIVSHAAVTALVTLQASDVCLKTLDSASTANLVPGALRVLQSLHQPRVVEALISRLETAPDAATRRGILGALCRLYHREADWDGRWWGTRPDTTGPYFKPAKWDASDTIGETLKKELSAAHESEVAWLARELQRNRVDLPELTAIVLRLAAQDEQFKTIAVELFSGRGGIPAEAIPLFASVASATQQPPALRAKAIRALRNANNLAASDAALDAIVRLTDAKPQADLNAAWEEFARDTKNAQRIGQFEKLAASGSPAERVVAYAVLSTLASQRLSTKEAKAAASRAIDQAWSRPESAVPLLHALGRLRNDAYALQVRGLMNSGNAELAHVARRTAQQLGLDQKRERAGEATIESLPFEQVVALAAPGKGEARRGRELFTKQGCVACHTTSADEPPKGPFLGDIGTRYNRAELCESILKPSAKVAQGFETQWFRMKDDEEFEGFVTREGGDDLDVRNVAGITTTLAKRNIAERGKRETSMMPLGLMDKATPQELASLLSFLESLKTK